MGKSAHHHHHKHKPAPKAHAAHKPQPPAPPWSPHPGLVASVLALGTLVIFWPLTGCDFLNYDDPAYQSGNLHVQGGLTLANAAWAFGTSNMSNWNPLTWISLMLDVTLFGKGPFGPHLMNILLHATDTALVFAVLRQLTGVLWRSAMVAALFALHPLHVESVAWVAERKDVLSTLFWLLTMWAYVKYVRVSTSESPAPPHAHAAQAESGPKVLNSDISGSPMLLANKPAVWYCLTLASFTLGLMAKPMVVTLPFALLLLDYWPLARTSASKDHYAGPVVPSEWLRLIIEKAPFFVLSAISSVLTLRIHQASGTTEMLQGVSLGARIGNGLVAYARYLGKTFWPVDLALPYPHPGSWPVEDVAFALLLVAGLCAAAVWQGRRRPYGLVGWFWFLGTLAPVIGVVQWGIQSMADRFTYVPLIGVFIVVVWSAEELLHNWHAPRVLIGAAAGAALGLCAVQTSAQLRYWQNSETWFRHTLAVTGKNRVACENLAGYLTAHGKLDDAIDNYRQALEMEPNRATAHSNLGGALTAKGDFQAAIREYQEALRLDPTLANAYNNLGYALAATGHPDDAEDDYRQALLLDPTLSSAHYNLGLALAGRGRLAEAMICYTNVLRLNPDHAPSHFQLGLALARTGRRAEAKTEIEEALRLRPDYPEARELMEELTAAEAK